MKVKCRGFEGNLISINPTTEITGLSLHYQTYLYTIRISINQTQEITISGVSDEDIEVIKEDDKKDINICHYLGNIKLKPVQNTENLYTIIGETISYQFVDEETGTKYIEEVTKRNKKITL